MNIRARFVDAEGRSFFEDIGRAREIYERVVPLDVTRPDKLVTRREVYRRELWHVPVGPLAWPVDHIDRIEAVYRIESIS